MNDEALERSTGAGRQEDTVSERKTGSIARLFADRVFGFIHCPADERDYFFHQAQLENCSFSKLQPGDVVTFVVGQDGNGRPEAQEVRFDHHDAPPGQEPREQVWPPARRQKVRH